MNAPAVPAVAHPDRLLIRTVGIDVGSSTTHCSFAELELARRATQMSSRFEVIARRVIWRSPVVFTPYLPGGLIDAPAVAAFVRQAYSAAGLAPEELDSGAVILTGSALLRRNAKSLAQALALGAGRLVCASAGHHLEAVLAAHGAGVVARPGLHLDVGGGTAKLAVIGPNGLGPTTAVGVGGRLLNWDQDRYVRGYESHLRVLLPSAGVPDLAKGDLLGASAEESIAEQMAQVVLLAAEGRTLPTPLQALQLTPPLPRSQLPSTVTMSGGVAAYLCSDPPPSFGDLGRALAKAIQRCFGRHGVEVVPVKEPLRATVTGAAQFSVQVSGSTVAVDKGVLPLRGLQVVSLGSVSEQVEPEQLATIVIEALERRRAGTDLPLTPALAFRFEAEPSYERLLRLARGLGQAWSESTYSSQPLVVVVDSDIGAALGALLRQEAPHKGSIVVLDGLEVGELDYMDAGEVLEPAGVVPVVVRSLVFGPTKTADALDVCETPVEDDRSWRRPGRLDTTTSIGNNILPLHTRPLPGGRSEGGRYEIIHESEE